MIEQEKFESLVASTGRLVCRLDREVIHLWSTLLPSSLPTKHWKKQIDYLWVGMPCYYEESGDKNNRGSKGGNSPIPKSLSVHEK